MPEIFSLTERAHATLRDIGPAVWNGGLSTFLAVLLLAFSSSYVFKTFFKVSDKERVTIEFTQRQLFPLVSCFFEMECDALNNYQPAALLRPWNLLK